MKVLKIRTWWVAILAICFLAPLLRADTLQLKDGRTVEGKYLGGTDSQITFYTNNQLEHFAIGDVKSIVFGDQTSSSTQPAPPAPSTPAPVVAAPQTSSQTGSQSNSQGNTQAPPATSANSSGAVVLVPAGTHFVVRMIDGIDSNRNRVGDTFQASLEEPLIVNSTEVAPKGTMVYGKLEQVKSAGKISGKSELRLALTGIVINGATHSIVTGAYSLQGKGRGKQTAERAGIGAAIGSVIGAIAGGGKGAAIGAGVGAGAGTAAQILTHGQQVHVPSETVLDFTLQQPVDLPIASS